MGYSLFSLLFSLFYIRIKFVYVIFYLFSCCFEGTGGFHLKRNGSRCGEEGVFYAVMKSLVKLCRKDRVASAGSAAEIPCAYGAGVKFIAVIGKNLGVVCYNNLFCSP